MNFRGAGKGKRLKEKPQNVEGNSGNHRRQGKEGPRSADLEGRKNPIKGDGIGMEFWRSSNSTPGKNRKTRTK